MRTGANESLMGSGFAPLRAMLVATVLSVAGCSADAQWNTYRDPAGFSLEMPAGWQVRSNTLTDIAVSDAQGRAAALVRARLARGDLARWLAETYPRTEPGMGQFRAEQTRSQGEDVAHAWISYVNPQGAAKRARVIAVRRGEMATVFVAAAPAEELKATLPQLARVLDSVRFEPASAQRAPAKAAPALQYAQWIDPRERAFAVQLPAGWHTEGGLQRTTWNVRVAYTSTSPDGSAQIFNGDTSLPRMFIMPNQTTRSLGNAEGVYKGPDSMMIAGFMRAEDFGAQLVRNRFRGEVTNARPRQDLVEITRRNPLLQQGVSAATAADVDFRLPDGRVGVLTVTTYGSMTGNVGGSWWAEGIHGFIAPPEHAAQVGRALGQMIASFQVNPQWGAGERDHQARMGQQYQEYLQYSKRLQQQTIDQRWASDTARQAGMRDILGGTVRLQDPQTGETFETTARDRYYYRVAQADRPTAIGTNTDFKPLPQIDMRRLLQVGVDVPDR